MDLHSHIHTEFDLRYPLISPSVCESLCTMVVTAGDRSEIAFFDVETTAPVRPRQGYAILEFGAILVCPRKLVEVDSYSTLVRPADLSLISTLSVRCNGITQGDVVSAPTFMEIADRVYDILHGRIWAGHNILRFDCTRIREAFEEINRPPPEPKGTIDSLAILTHRFGRRAGDMKMATLAAYFGLGQQTHRSLDDVRMNLEVLKYCATVLFLESSLPDVLTASSWVSPNATTRNRSNGSASCDGLIMSTIDTSSSSIKIEKHIDTSSSSIKIENHDISSPINRTREGTLALPSPTTPNTGEEAHPDPFNMGPLSVEVERQTLQSDHDMDEGPSSESPESSTDAAAESEGSSGYPAFLEPDKLYIPSISASLAPFYRGIQRIQIMYRDVLLQLCCTQLKVRFGVSTKFVDYAGRPRLSFVVEPTPNLCRVLDACDNLVQRLSADSGSSSEWRPTVTRKGGFMNLPTVRLHIPTVADGSVSRWLTEIYEREISATPQRLMFSRFEVAELYALFTRGTSLDAYFSLDPYDYQQSAGIRLVAKKLVIHSNGQRRTSSSLDK